jgi:hypothetical protein
MSVGFSEPYHNIFPFAQFKQRPVDTTIFKTISVSGECGVSVLEHDS